MTTGHSDQNNKGTSKETAEAIENTGPLNVNVSGENWIVEYKEGVGNHVVATRDIKPNEVDFDSQILNYQRYKLNKLDYINI